MKLPQIKKKANEFLLNEDGKISKKYIIIAGVTLLAFASTIPSVEARFCCRGHTSSPHSSHNSVHVNNISLTCDSKAACSGSHAHSFT